MKKQITLLAATFVLTSCLFDDAKKKVDEVASDLNGKLKEAKRTVDGFIEDPELREEAIAELKKMIPDSLWVASNMAPEGEDYQEKISVVEEVFAAGSGIESSLEGVKHCLGAIPKAFPNRGNPKCYGPTLNYNGELHPDKPTSGPSGPGDCTGNCQLPSLDLGLWEAKEGEEACAAAKVNQLTANASYFTDLAVGSLAAMVCAAGFYGDTIPSAEALDLTQKFKVASGFDVDLAKIQKVDGAFETEFEGDLGGVDAWIKVSHNPTSQSGLLQIKMTPQNQAQSRAISIVYQRSEGTLTYRMANAGYSVRDNGPTPNPVIDVEALLDAPFDKNGEVKLGSSDWTDDLNILWVSQAKDKVDLTYGWQAGSGDGFLRVFNANTAADAGQAWFGYTPHGTETMAEVGKLLKIDRMICNWAGPGNQRAGKDLVQSQKMKKSAGTWAPIESNIHYIPVNACSMDSDPTEVFPTITGSGTHELNSGTSYRESVKFPISL